MRSGVMSLIRKPLDCDTCVCATRMYDMRSWSIQRKQGHHRIGAMQHHHHQHQRLRFMQIYDNSTFSNTILLTDREPADLPIW